MSEQSSQRRLRWHKQTLPPTIVATVLMLMVVLGAVGYGQSVRLQTLNRINNELIDTWRSIAIQTDHLHSRYKSANRALQAELQSSIAELAETAADQEARFQNALEDPFLLKLMSWLFSDRLAAIQQGSIDAQVRDKVRQIIQSPLDQFSSGYAGWSSGTVVDFRNGELVKPLRTRQEHLVKLHTSLQKRLFITLCVMVLGALAGIIKGVTTVLIPTLSALEAERNVASDEARSLELSQKRLTLLVDRISESVVFTDPDGMITRMNPAAEELTGNSEENAQGQSLNSVILLIDPGSRKPLRSLFQNRKLFQTPGAGVPSILQDLQGNEHPVIVQCIPIHNDMKQDVELIWTVVSVPVSEFFDIYESRNIA